MTEFQCISVAFMVFVAGFNFGVSLTLYLERRQDRRLK